METIGLRHGLVNVFPVTYYRKITLDQQSQLRISSNAAQDRSPRGSLPEDSVEKKLEKKHKKKKDKLTKDKKNKKKKKSFKDSLKRNSRERSDSENRSGSSVESSISNRIHNNNAPIQPVSESNLPLKNEVPVFS